MSYSVVAGLGEEEGALPPRPISVETMQRGLWAARQSPSDVMPGTVDGRWGTNTRNSLVDAFGAGILSTPQPGGQTLGTLATGVRTVSIPGHYASDLEDSARGYRGQGAPRPSASVPDASSGASAEVETIPGAAPPAGGSDLSWLPWVLGGVAVVGVGGYIVWSRRKS